MDKETQGFGSIFFVFAGYVLSVTAFLVGGNAGNQLSFTKGMLALFVGNMILAIYAGSIGYIGRKTKKSSTEIFKPVYGVKGQVIISTIVSLFSLVFVSVYCSLVGSITASLFGLKTPYIGLLLYLVLIVFINYKGFKGMSIFSKLAVPAIGVFIVYGIITIGQKVGFTNVFTAQPSDPAPLLSVISVIAASWMTGATFSSDITRFVKKPYYVFLVTVGSFLCVTILEGVGLLCALGTGQSDIVQILADLNMSAVAFVIYLLLTITSGQAVLYIAAQAMENITKVVRGRENMEDDGKFTAKFFILPSCIFAGIIGVIMTANGLTSMFSSWLGIIGIAIPPVGGTVVAHFLLVEREYKNTFLHMPDYRWQAFVSWLSGVAASAFINMGIKPMNGFIVSIIVYFVLRKITDKAKEGNTIKA